MYIKNNIQLAGGHHSVLTIESLEKLARESSSNDPSHGASLVFDQSKFNTKTKKEAKDREKRKKQL